jgi:hypothetical protein
MFLRYLLLFLFFSPIAFAQISSFYNPPRPLSGSNKINAIDWKEYFAKLEKTDPAKFAEYQQIQQRMDDFNSKNTMRQTFISINVTNNDFYTVEATLVKTGDNTQIWVEDSYWESGKVNQAVVDELFSALETDTDSDIYDGGIVDINERVFGQPPDRDGDGITDFLILDVIDGFDPDTSPGFVAGFFWTADQTGGANNRDILYLDAEPGIYFEDNRRTETVLATAAHEYQHLIHYNYDTNEDTWFNESMSELAAFLCGYPIDGAYFFLNNSNRSLTAWSGEGSLQDYAKVSLFGIYFFRHLGEEIVRSAMQSPAQSIDAINNALQSQGGAFQNFDELYENWAVANVTNTSSINTSSEKYFYDIPGGSHYRVNDIEFVSEYDIAIDRALAPYSSRYFRILAKDTLLLNASNNNLEYRLIMSSELLFSDLRVANGQLEIAGINEDQLVYLVVSNLTTTNQSTKIQLASPWSFAFKTYQYDDNELDFSLGTVNAIGNHFSMDGEINIPIEAGVFISFPSSIGGRLALYDASAGVPGTLEGEIPFTGFDAIGAWLNVPVTDIGGSAAFFAAVELDEATVFAYDENSRDNGRSYFFDGANWQRLRDAGRTGNWMLNLKARGPAYESSGTIDPDGDAGAEITGVFPNPSIGGQLNITLAATSGGIVEFKIYDITGRKVATQSYPVNGEGTFDYYNVLSAYHLPSGAYVVTGEFKPVSGGTKYLNGQVWVNLK